MTHYCENGNTVTITGETTGIIKTLVSGTSQYGNNLNCGWVINGGTGNRIQMLIGGVNLQSAPVYTSCGGYDHLSIKDGNVIYNKICLNHSFLYVCRPFNKRWYHVLLPT